MKREGITFVKEMREGLAMLAQQKAAMLAKLEAEKQAELTVQIHYVEFKTTAE